MQVNSTKMEIIREATDVIYEKGYHGTSIAEIADRVGVSASVIYKHFENKDDLLFSIPSENSIQFFRILENDLQGIEGNENLLRKLSWSLLHFYDNNPKYAIILLMECRANRDFYRSQAYGFIKRFNKMFVTMFEAGKECGEFNRYANTTLIRDLFFGGMDYSVLSCLVLNEIPKITDDAKGLFQLFKNMKRIPIHGMKEKSDKKSLLLDAAIEVFNQRGYHKATISEIAGRAQVSDGILYQYFENKEDLLFTLAERKIGEDLATLDEMFHITDPCRKLRRFIRYHCHLCLTDLGFLYVFLSLIQTNRKFYQLPAYNPLKQYGEFLMNIIHEGQREGVFMPEINPRIFRNMFLGGINHMFFRWLIVGEVNDTDKISEIEQVTDLLTASVSK